MNINDTKTECPACGKQSDAAVAINTKSPPMPGDVLLCNGCGSINAYGKDMQLVLVPDEVQRTAPDLALARQWQAKIRRQLGLPVKEDA